MYYDIVIVGGGAGGLELAARLGRWFGREQGAQKVLLIDRAGAHIWKPTLHEVAVGTLNTQQEGLSYQSLGRRNHFSFMRAQPQQLHPETHQLTLAPVCDVQGEFIIAERTIEFGKCVLALGSGSNFFGTSGSEHAYVLENLEDAERFYNQLSHLFSWAEYSDHHTLNVSIVGGGATGVELAAELREAYRLFAAERATPAFQLNITLIEAGARILATLPEKMSQNAAQILQSKQVTVLTSTKVLALHRDHITTSAGELAADAIVWAAGIKAAETNRDFGLTVNALNQFIVDEQLRTSAADIYAIGDCAACLWRDGKNVPARAQAAHQQAFFLFKQLRAIAQNKAFRKRYRYRDFGSLIALGGKDNIGNLIPNLLKRHIFIEGIIAKYMYLLLHLAHHQLLLGYGKTFLLVLARFAQNRLSGRLKWH